eukprot:6191951-Pleurochrysis_carterae.AAC.1
MDSLLPLLPPPGSWVNFEQTKVTRISSSFVALERSRDEYWRQKLVAAMLVRRCVQRPTSRDYRYEVKRAGLCTATELELDACEFLITGYMDGPHFTISPK